MARPQALPARSARDEVDRGFARGEAWSADASGHFEGALKRISEIEKSFGSPRRRPDRRR